MSLDDMYKQPWGTTLETPLQHSDFLLKGTKTKPMLF